MVIDALEYPDRLRECVTVTPVYLKSFIKNNNSKKKFKYYKNL